MSKEGADKSGLRVLRDSSIYVGGTIIQRGLALILLPIVTRILDVSEYGLVGTATALGALLAIVFGLGMNFAIVRSFYEDPSGPHAAGWSALLRAQAVIAGAIALLVFLTGPLWGSLFHGFGWGPALELAVLYGYLTGMQSTVQGVLRAARKPIAFVIVTVIQVLVGSGLGIGLAINGGATGYMAGLCIGAGAACVIAFLITRRPPLWRRDIITGGLSLGLPFMVNGLAGWGISLADRVLIGLFLSLAAVGRYQVAYVLGSAAALLLTGIQAAWAPHYQGEMEPEVRRRIPPLLVLPVTAVAGAAVGLLVVATPLLLDVLAPKAYGGTELIVALVAAATLPRAPYFMAVVVLIDAKKSSAMATGSIAGVILNIAVNVALIPTLGLPAAAAATAGAVAVQAIVVLRQAEVMLDQSMRLKELVVAWTVGTLALAGLSQLPDSGSGLALRGIAAVAICALGVAALRWLRHNFRAGHTLGPAASPAASAA